MNRTQKIAWYQLIVIILGLGVTAVVVGAVVYTKGIECAHIGLIPLILLVFVHFDRVFFPIKAGQIVFDERDEVIAKRAVVTAYTVFWVAFILGGIVPLFVLGSKATISVGVLPCMVFCGAIIIRVVWSVAVIVQYGRGGKDG
ncbi:MAG: hypothetical protein JSV82_02440, partial [Planctomycetota bacterium]